MSIFDRDILNKIVSGQYKRPYTILGLHKEDGHVSYCGWFPHASGAYIIRQDNAGVDKPRVQLDKVNEAGLYTCSFTDEHENFPYTIEYETVFGETFKIYDPYSFQLTVEKEIYFDKKFDRNIYEHYGAHVMECYRRDISEKNYPIKGTRFVVWAPDAARVSVVGEFNYWDGRCNQMEFHKNSGLWETFIPELDAGEMYKYEIRTNDGRIILKADPVAFFSQTPPETASVIYDIDKYVWNDELWLNRRANTDILSAPMSIYEVHLGSWNKKSDPNGENGYRYLTYSELTEELIDYVVNMKFTHIELMPVQEHPYDGSWGYQTTGYFAATSRYGTPDGLKGFIDKCHANGIGIIIDWVPAHFPKDAHGLAQFDGEPLYEYRDKQKAEHPEWGTVISDFGRKEVADFFVSNAVFWIEKYHVDGIRVDAVTSMLYLDYSRKRGEWQPNKFGGNENLEAIDFIKRLNETVKDLDSGVYMIAEESSNYSKVSWPVEDGGLGFDFKWNMGWMNDFLQYISADPYFRKYMHRNITFSMMYAYNENYVLALSHDEVVHGKKSLLDKNFGEYEQKFAGLRVAFGFQFAHPGKKLMFMGDEIGQFIEWDEKRPIDWILLEYPKHREMKLFVCDLNALYRKYSCMYKADYTPSGFEWSNCNDADRSIVSMMRKDDGDVFLLIVCNFTPVSYDNYIVGVPYMTQYNEIMNSNEIKYGGTGLGINGCLTPIDVSCNGKAYSLELKVPPFGFLVFEAKKEKGENDV